MISDRKRSANRANAAKSTGPKSQAGKHRAGQNALRHGLKSKVADPSRTATSIGWAQTFCHEDPDLSWPVALAIAQALLGVEDVARAGQDLMHLALQAAPPSSSLELDEDLALIAAMPRICALDGYARRAAGTLRKALRSI